MMGMFCGIRLISKSKIQSSDWLIGLPFQVSAMVLILQIISQSWKLQIPDGAESEMSKRCILGQVFN